MWQASYRASQLACARVSGIQVFNQESILHIPGDVAHAINTFRNTICKTKWFVPIRSRHGDWTIEDELTLVAMRTTDGRVMGTIAFNDPDTNGRLEIEYVCSSSGCGYGRELMRRFFDWLHGNMPDLHAPPEWTSITLTSVPDAVGFYHKMGFVTHTGEDAGEGLSLIYRRANRR